MGNNIAFTPPKNISHDGTEYEFVKDYIFSLKNGDRLSEKCYLYLQLNKIGKEQEIPLVEGQIHWMLNNKTINT